MKRFIFCLFAVMLFASCAYCKELNIGTLTYLGTTESAFQEGLDSLRSGSLSFDDEFISNLVKIRRRINFYDSLMSLLMSLKSGKLDEIMLPETAARYLVSHNKSHEIEFKTKILSSGISFGFRSDNQGQKLKQEFDEAINSMKADGTLEALEAKYIHDPANNQRSIQTKIFKDAPTIRVAVTGDLPPVDMFAGDGRPAGYNTAVLAEIGRRLGKNIKLINIDSGGRSAALSSGRADVVFWYRSSQSEIEGEDPLDDLFKDVPEGVILSVPYFSWTSENILVIRNTKGFWSIFSR